MLGPLPGGIRRRFPRLDEGLHAQEIIIHLPLRISPEERRHDLAAPRNYGVL
jgi:hypothetical protein